MMARWHELLAEGGLPRLEARLLLEHASGRARSWLIAHGDETADPAVARQHAALVRRRLAGEPIAYLIGHREFHGLPFRVDASVLIPRAETEVLVDRAVALAPPGSRLLDLGTGSGAAVIAIALARPDLQVVATDLSGAALRVAQANADALLSGDRPGGALRLLAGDWWQALPEGELAFQTIISNPPYVAEGDPHLAEGDLRFEPRAALVSGREGLDALRRIAGGASAFLSVGGRLLLEHGHEQGEAVRSLFSAEGGWTDVRTTPDAEGRPRVTESRLGGEDDRAVTQGLESSPFTLDAAKEAEVEPKEFITKTVSENPVVLFMKGSAQFPQCGFSGRAVQILQACGLKDFVTVDVLEDEEVRQGIKDYSSWPTIPQLYVNGEFVGGSDIVYEMYQSGELQKMLPVQAAAS